MLFHLQLFLVTKFILQNIHNIYKRINYPRITLFLLAQEKREPKKISIFDCGNLVCTCFSSFNLKFNLAASNYVTSEAVKKLRTIF